MVGGWALRIKLPLRFISKIGKAENMGLGKGSEEMRKRWEGGKGMFE